MLKTQNQKERSGKKNKGFSLVELIVVIAIMAVLVAVLAPQFTKYIDQSRKSNDAATVSGIVTAAQVGIADVKTYSNIKPATYTITVAEAGTTVACDLADTEAKPKAEADMTEAIKASCGDLGKLKRTAHKWGADITIQLIYSTDGTVTITYEPDDFAKYIEKTATTPDTQTS